MYEDFKKRKHEKYFYCAVSGASLWFKGSFIKAKSIVQKLRKGEYSNCSSPLANAEIERGRKVGFSGQRYWRWRNGDWSTQFWIEPTENDLKKWN